MEKRMQKDHWEQLMVMPMVREMRIHFRGQRRERLMVTMIPKDSRWLMGREIRLVKYWAMLMPIETNWPMVRPRPKAKRLRLRWQTDLPEHLVGAMPMVTKMH